MAGSVDSNAATFNPNSFSSAHSRSQQFVVTGAHPGMTPLPKLDPQATADTILVETGVLAVSCERIKTALLRELGLQDQWSGKIFINIRPYGADRQIYVRTEPFIDGWRYRVDMPERVEPQKMVRAIVQVLLQEIANRSTLQKGAEVPLWLWEGFTTHLLATDGFSVILELRKELVVTRQREDPLRDARARLSQHQALSFSDLSLPASQQINGPAWETYRSSAHTFVAELLKLRGGRECLQEFLRQLPNYLNSQIAFLRAFQPHFQTMLDVEKWWSASLVGITGRDQHLRWPLAESLQRLDQILRAPVDVRAGTNTLPQRSEVRLQQVFEKLDFSRQKAVLHQTLTQLQALQWNSPQDLAKLVEDYRQTLIAYLQKRQSAGQANEKTQTTSLKSAVRDVVRQLDLLDVIRADYQNFGVPLAQSKVSP